MNNIPNIDHFCSSAFSHLATRLICSFLFFSTIAVTGGDSKVVMFVQISPSDNDASETLSSLNFDSHVRGIELGPAKKQVDTAELQKVEQMVSVDIPEAC